MHVVRQVGMCAHVVCMFGYSMLSKQKCIIFISDD